MVVDYSPKPVPPELRQCRKLLPIRLRPPALTCFSKAESRNLNHLILISLRLARATRAGVLRRETPATYVAGRAAYAILGGAYLISWPGR